MYPISDITVLMLFGSQLDLGSISEEILTATEGQAAFLPRKRTSHKWNERESCSKILKERKNRRLILLKKPTKLHEEIEDNCSCKSHKLANAFESLPVNFSIYHIRSTFIVIWCRP